MDELQGAIQDVFDDIKKKFREFQDQEPLWNVIQGFVHAIDWKEPWIQGLVATHVLILLLALVTRKNTTIQSSIFAVAVLMVWLGERLNKLGSEHWQRFSSQDYFDPHGVFYGVMVAGPLLLVLFVVLVNYLLSCVSLLIQAKKMELKYKARQRKKAETVAAGQGEGKKQQ